jgi:hypothetical protein
MADLSITMNGDASGAAGAMKDVAHEASALHQLLEGGLKGALGSTVGALTSFEAAGEKVVDIFKESLQEYAKPRRRCGSSPSWRKRTPRPSRRRPRRSASRSR